jgi:hypothetical protein
MDVLVQAAIPAAKEQTSGGRRRPTDILLVAWERGHDVAVDLTVTRPLGLASHPIVVKSAKQHCRRAEEAKTAAEGDLCRQAGWGFVPAGKCRVDPARGGKGTSLHYRGVTAV